jgi:hypothetical protein
MSSSPNSLSTLLPGISGSAAVHSNDIYQADLQHVQVTLTSAQILALYVTPIQLVAAPVSTMSIVPERWRFRMIATSTAYASGGVVGIQFGSTGSGGSSQIGNTIAAAIVNTATPGTVDTLVQLGASNITLTQGSGLYLSNLTGAFTTGTGTAVVDVWYAIN